MQNDSTNETIKLFHLKKPLNSNGAEYGAYIFIDKNNNILFFSSLRDSLNNNSIDKNNYTAKIFKTEIFNNDSFSKNIIPLPENINKYKYHNANISFLKDKKKIYFSRCDSNFICKIYIADYFIKNNKFKFKNIKLLPNINFDSASSTHPFVSELNNKYVLFFSSNFKGKGKYDIWYSYLDNNGIPGKAKNMEKINSIDNEITPFFDKKEKKLYFSSDWYFGFGGFDIFYSKYDSINGFLMPKNLGIPFNSSANDLYYSIYDTLGFFSSNRDSSFSIKNASCCNDIYMFKIRKKKEKDTIPPEFKSIEQLNKYLPITLYFHNDEPDPNTLDTVSSKDYYQSYKEYIKLLPEYQKEYSKGLSGKDKENAENIIYDFFINYVEKGFENLMFFKKLLLEELKKGVKIELIIKGYASPLAKSDYNVNLTLRRISSLIKYFENDSIFKNFIDSGHLRFSKIPFGEFKASKLVSDNPNDKKHSVYSRAAALERKIEILTSKLQNNSNKGINIETGEISLYPVIKWEETTFNFGKISYNSGKIYHNFNFKNSGNDTLEIVSAYSLKKCPCISVKVSEKKVPPGKEGTIKVYFDTSKRKSYFKEKIKVITNCKQGIYYLNIEGRVE